MGKCQTLDGVAANSLLDGCLKWALRPPLRSLAAVDVVAVAVDVSVAIAIQLLLELAVLPGRLAFRLHFAPFCQGCNGRMVLYGSFENIWCFKL